MPFQKRKIVPINYTDRDFSTIKNSLVQHAKRYYPDTYQDFSEAGFGSLLLDTVAYVGDMLSFYVDYQANESFLNTAQLRSSVVSHAETLGYVPKSYTSSSVTSLILSFKIVLCIIELKDSGNLFKIN